jgi:arylsulfatase A-like enzyme
MPEGQSGRFEKPSSGELQARAAEKIIQDAQRRPRQSILGNERVGGATTSASAQEHRDKHSLDNIRKTFKSLDEWKQRVFRKQAEPQTDKAPQLITAHGVATTPEEVDRLFEEHRKESEKNFERQRKEAFAKINATNRLPF